MSCKYYYYRYRYCCRLVEIFAAAWRATAARNFDVFQREFVVVGELFAALDAAQGQDDDVLLQVNIHDAGVAVGLSTKQ